MPTRQLPLSRGGKPNPVDIHVGSRVRMRRTLLGFSQTKLGAAAGLTFQQIQKYERAANRISASRLHQFAQILDVPTSYFFEEMPTEKSGKGGKTAPGGASRAQNEASPDALAKRETLKLVRAYYRIKDSDVRKRVYKLVKSLSEIGK